MHGIDQCRDAFRWRELGHAVTEIKDVSATVPKICQHLKCLGTYGLRIREQGGGIKIAL
jgi:hypothetical protein